MEIILAILKIIGLVLLILLLTLLVIIAILLFMPFVYSFRVEYLAKKFSLQGEISFLFKLIRAKLSYENELSYDLNIAYFTLASSEKSFENKHKKTEKEIKKISKAKTKTKQKKEPVEKTKGIGQKAEKEEKQTDREEKQADLKKEEKSEKKQKKKISIISKIKQKLEAIKTKWEQFQAKLKSLNIKKDAIIKFVNAEGTLRGVGYLLTQGKILIKMILPKTIKGWLKFGTGDVYTEGQYLSYLCLLYPLYGGKLEIEPEWEEEVFETDALFSGRITMFTILLVTLRVLFNKKVKLLRNNFNKCKKSLAKG